LTVCQGAMRLLFALIPGGAASPFDFNCSSAILVTQKQPRPATAPSGALRPASIPLPAVNPACRQAGTHNDHPQNHKTNAFRKQSNGQ
jgi:hypothetical protein